MPTTTPSRAFCAVVPSFCACAQSFSWHSTQLTLCATPGLWGISVMSLWHSMHWRLPCTLCENLSGMT